MKRIDMKPRPNWQNAVESQGLLWHSDQNNRPYWDESAAYELTSSEVDELEKATLALNDMVLEATDYVISKDEVLDSFAISELVRPIIRSAWQNEEISVFGRFDLSYDGKNPPKLLEYNADTPTSLLEQSVIQWQWLQDKFKAGDLDSSDKIDQFNSTHERLIEVYKAIMEGVDEDATMHFTSLSKEAAVEDYVTINYLRDTAMQAGWNTQYLSIDRLGYQPTLDMIVDEEDAPIRFMTKLYPWEWLSEESIGEYLSEMPAKNLPRFFEPPWKNLVSNKALLVLLYEMFPKSPYLLRASYDPSDMGRTYVKKPQFSREGANITVVEKGKTTVETQGEYGETDLWVYQDYYPLPDFNGKRPVFGSWMVNGYATGIGIREDDGPITGNFSRFIPHYFNNKQPGFITRLFG